MVKNVAPPKNTSGEGYVFEAKVAAWILASMLAKRPLLDEDLGVPVRVDFQVRPTGWYLDDVLVTSRDATAMHRFQLSVKSNSQFTAGGAPSDFVKSIWEQWLHIGSTVFSRTDDYLVLVTAAPSDAARQSIEGLLHKILPADPQVFVANMATPKWASENERSLFASFACPASLLTAQKPTQEDVATLLKQVRFIHCDFDHEIAHSLAQSLWLCELCVRSGSKADSKRLWDRLCDIVNTYRLAGTMTREQLIDELRHDFELAESPDYVSDWRKLDGISAQNAAGVPNLIGRIVDLPRTKAVDAIENAIPAAGVIALLGASGAGKSVIARKLFERRMASDRRTVWVDARSLECRDMHAFEAALTLSYPLRELLPNTPSVAPVLIVDGLDRIYGDTAFRNAATLIKIAREVAPAAQWRVLIPCQSLEWNRVSERLGALGVMESIETVPLEPIAFDDLAPVVALIPAIGSLLAQPRVATLLLNLKLLDLVARKIREGTAVSDAQWVSEVSVAGWFWEVEVSRGDERVARGQFVRNLALRQADLLVSAVAVDDFGSADLAALPSLQADQICQSVANDRLAFSHDLYGDWARLRTLDNRRHELADFLKDRADSPLWQRALRLYGVSVVERPEGIAEWRSVLESLGDGGHVAAKDAYLESLLYSGNVREHLDALLPVLQDNGGALLQRLLTRFLVFGTGPGKIARILQSEPQTTNPDSDLVDRAPNHPVWPEVIKFLHQHRQSVLVSQASKVAELVLLWLENASKDDDAWREAAELGLALGRCSITAFRDRKRTFTTEDRRSMYRCMLLAADAFPDEAGGLAKEAAGLGDTSESEDPEVSWPGPNVDVDEAFRSTVLSGRKIQKLFEARPALAREVILATLLKEPATSSIIEFDWRHEGSIFDRRDWLPITYIHGPFLMCLHLNFDEGLDLINRLVDLATSDASLNEQEKRGQEDGITDRDALTLVMERGLKKFYGDDHAFLWSIGAGGASRNVTVALMALEQYLYMYIDANQDIDAALEAILTRSSSVAILGVLVDVGKRKPALFSGPLRPLLSEAAIFLWDIKKVAQKRNHLEMWGVVRPPQLVIDVAVSFKDLPHRTENMQRYFATLVDARPLPTDYLARVRDQWRSVKDSEALVASIRSDLIGFLDPEWRTKGLEQATKEALEGSISKKAQWSDYDGLMAQAQCITIALRCRQFLDESVVLEQGALEALWQKCTSLVEAGRQSIPASEYSLGDEWENAVNGCIAVLLRHPDWCAAHPSRQQWIADTLYSLWRKLPETSIGIDDSSAPFSWESFMAESIATLWVADIGNPRLRELVASMTMSPRKFAMRAKLFEVCARVRSELGEDFYRLRSLAMEASWAAVRCELFFQFHQHFEMDNSQLELIAEQLDKWITDRVASFESGEQPARLARWQEYDRTGDFPDIETKRKEWGHPVFDLDVIRSANGWLPLPNDALNDMERESVVEFWKDAASFMAKRAVARYESSGDSCETEGDDWVLENLAAVLLQCTVDDEPHSFWMPVLDLPKALHAFPESFMQALHRSALASDQVPTPYVDTVRAIVVRSLDFSDEVSAWPSRETVWDSLLGVDTFSQPAWKIQHEPIVRRLADVVRLWIREAPLNGLRLAGFVDWVLGDAASSLRLDVLRWIDELVQRDELASVSDASIAYDRIANLLSNLWSRQEPAIRADAKTFAAFRRLLDWLVGQQNARALFLSRHLGSSDAP